MEGGRKHVYIETYGCQMNELDSRRMLGFLRNADFTPTQAPQDADLILINTCSVRKKAEDKVYSAAGRFKMLKTKKPGLIIAVSGCVAQEKGEELIKKIPHIDMVVGTANIHRIPSLLKEIEGARRPVAVKIAQTMEDAEWEAPAQTGVRGMVGIMRGCNNFCSYCIVPYVRGREISRPVEGILEEIRLLAQKSAKEITLVGQNVNSYAGEVGFVELLRMVARVEGIDRVRFVTSHPKDVSEELIELFSLEPKLARSMHFPLQSGSTRVLERMKRGYSAAEYLEKAKRLRRLYPDISVTTDIIVGFPGETEEDFAETMAVVEGFEFDGIFSFKYSPRPKTEASGFPDQVADDIKQRRLETLQSTQKAITRKRNKLLVGKTATVLVEGAGRNMELTGRTSCGRVVNFPGPKSIAGRMAEVKITAGYANSLRGVLI